MGSEYEIVPYRPEHRPAVVALQRHLWGPDAAGNESYFAWKYEANPYLREPVIALAIHRGTVVGMRGLCGARWEVGAGGTRVDLPFVDDLVVAPEHRDRGLAGRLIRATLASAKALGCPLVLSLRAGTVTMMSSLAAGFRSLGAMEPVVRMAEGTRVRLWFLDRLKRKRLLWRVAGSPMLRSRAEREPFRRLDRGASLPGGIAVSSRPPIEAMAALFAAEVPDPRIRQLRDATFLDWAFRNPRLDFRFLTLGGDRLEAILVLHQLRFGPGLPARVEVAEWEGVSEAAREAVMAAAIAGGRFPELMCWTATAPPGGGEVLTRMGFVPGDLEQRVRGVPAALVYPTGETADAWTLFGVDAAVRAHWRFCLLDQD